MTPDTRAPGCLLAVVTLGGCSGSSPPPGPPAATVEVRLVAVAGEQSVRLARDPSSNDLYALRRDGTLLRLGGLGQGTVAVETMATAAETGVVAPQGMVFGTDGSLYLVGNEQTATLNVGLVRKGVPMAGGSWSWHTLARTEPYPRSAFEHLYNAVAVSPDGRFVFVNAGARTDHGEEQPNGGASPGVREVPLSARILRLPADAEDLRLPNDEVGVERYVYARGVRNTFDLAWNADGELFGAENSGDRDDPDELNWIREGGHYGFPWRMGTNDTPQQLPGYLPEADPLVDQRFGAYTGGFFHDDPDYPPRPPITFLDPIPNAGPDADSFRDPETRAVRRASEAGGSLGTFTAHRAPSGLVFDVGGALPGRFRGGAFVVSFTRGDATGDTAVGPFRDASEDLLFLDLTRSADGYRLGATSVVCGFDHPLDAEPRSGKLYVLEYPTGRVYELGLPEVLPASCTRVPR